MIGHGDEEDLLKWTCKFCRIGTGINSTHKCQVLVSPSSLTIKWWSGPMQRERKFLAKNILRASSLEENKFRVVVHILTTPDSNGESEYKQYEVHSFSHPDGIETFSAAVNAVAFSARGISGKCLVFINPISGTRSGPKRFRLVEPLFRLVGVECDTVVTTHHGHASEIVSKVDIEKYSAIISVSGDGTLNEIFTALISRHDGAKAILKPVGIIPAGSEGTLAKISTFFNSYAAAYIILKCHEVRPLDVLRIVQQDITMFSVCGVGWGIPGKVAEESENLRSTYGRSRYAVSAIKEIIAWKGCKGTLEVLPARERPLCTCGPNCLRCRSGAAIAAREEEVDPYQGGIKIADGMSMSKLVAHIPKAVSAKGQEEREEATEEASPTLECSMFEDTRVEGSEAVKDGSPVMKKEHEWQGIGSTGTSSEMAGLVKSDCGGSGNQGEQQRDGLEGGGGDQIVTEPVEQEISPSEQGETRAEASQMPQEDKTEVQDQEEQVQDQDQDQGQDEHGHEVQDQEEHDQDQEDQGHGQKDQDQDQDQDQEDQDQGSQEQEEQEQEQEEQEQEQEQTLEAMEGQDRDRETGQGEMMDQPKHEDQDEGEIRGLQGAMQGQVRQAEDAAWKESDNEQKTAVSSEKSTESTEVGGGEAFKANGSEEGGCMDSNGSLKSQRFEDCISPENSVTQIMMADEGSPEDVSVEYGVCVICGTEFSIFLESVPQPCPRCGRRRRKSDEFRKFEGKEYDFFATASTENQASSGLVSIKGGVIAIRRASQDSDTEEAKEMTVVELDYSRRLKGLNDVSDRGSALLHLAEKWREEQEESNARNVSPQRSPSTIPAEKPRRREVWQRLNGTFLAIGCLNTEKISAPFVHLSDGCMDVIAVPGGVGSLARRRPDSS